MGKVVPLNKKKIIKKREKSFERHQHQQFFRIGRSSWRKSKGNIIIIIIIQDRLIYMLLSLLLSINCSIEDVIYYKTIININNTNSINNCYCYYHYNYHYHCHYHY